MNTRRHFLLGGLTAAILAVATPPAAWAARWRRLGTRTVRLIADRDVIPVTFLKGTFSHLRLRVRDNAIFVHELRVHFTNGQSTSLPVRFLIRNGGQTRAINLPGARRFIRAVELRYRSVPNAKGRATVELWGLG